MKQYITNPTIRCILCKGRQVISIDGHTIEDNLTPTGRGFVCKDKQECKQNIDAENAVVDLEFNEDNKLIGITTELNGESIEVKNEI